MLQYSLLWSLFLVSFLFYPLRKTFLNGVCVGSLQLKGFSNAHSLSYTHQYQWVCFHIACLD